MARAENLRRKYYVDADVQGALVKQAARYWMLSLAVIGMLTVVGWIFVAPGAAVIVNTPQVFTPMLSCLAVAFTVTVLVGPIVLYDLVRFSHRFVGPMYRLRNAMQRAAKGESVGPIRFRDGDYWQEFAEAFNAIEARLAEESTRAVRSPSPETECAKNQAALDENLAHACKS